MPPRFYPTLLLLLLLAGIGGYYPLFKLEQWHLHKEAKARIRQSLNKKDLIRFEVSQKNQDEITWERRGEEFKYLGNMYDVVRTETLGQTTIYYCVSDDAEDILSEKMERMIQDELKKEKSSSGQKESFIKLLLTIVYLVDDNISFDHEVYTSLWSPSFPIRWTQGFIGDILHPPRF